MKTALNKPILFFLILITLTTIFVLAGQAKVSEVDLSSAVGIWLFDEGAGNATADLSEKGNHATLVKNPKWVAGKFGKALEFNGKDTCVQTGKKLLDAREEFTIVAWIKPGKITANRVGLLGQNDSPEFGFINPDSFYYTEAHNDIFTRGQRWENLTDKDNSRTGGLMYDGPMPASIKYIYPRCQTKDMLSFYISNDFWNGFIIYMLILFLSVLLLTFVFLAVF